MGKRGVGIGSCVWVKGMWGSMGEVWKSVWGECGGCVEVGESVLGCGEVWGCGGANTLFHTSPHTPTLTRHLFPHSPDTSLHIFSHSPPTSHLPTLSHTSPHPSHFSFTSPTVSHTHSPYFLTTPTPPPTLPYAPHTLPFTSCQNFSLFSFIA